MAGLKSVWYVKILKNQQLDKNTGTAVGKSTKDMTRQLWEGIIFEGK